MQMFEILSAFIGSLDKPVVLIIDEVDGAANNQVFLDFLAQLRNGVLPCTIYGKIRALVNQLEDLIQTFFKIHHIII